MKDAFEFVRSTAPDVPFFNDYFDSSWMNGQYPIDMWLSTSIMSGLLFSNDEVGKLT